MADAALVYPGLAPVWRRGRSTHNNNNIMPHTEQYHTVRCTLTKRHGSPKSAQCMAKGDRIKNNRIWRCGRGRRWWVVGGFSRDGEDEWRGWGWQAARGSARNGSAGGRDARSADEAARSKPRPLLPRWALGVAWLGCGNEERSGVSRKVDAKYGQQRGRTCHVRVDVALPASQT